MYSSASSSDTCVVENIIAMPTEESFNFMMLKKNNIKLFCTAMTTLSRRNKKIK